MLAVLLDAGHESAAVMDKYSIEEVEAHYHAVQRLDARKRLQVIADLMAGTGNMQKGLRRKHLKSLGSTAEKIWLELRKASKSQMERLFDDFSSVCADKGDKDDGTDNRRLPRQRRNRQNIDR